MQDERKLSLTDVEWRIMRALWTLSEPTLGDIVREVADAGWSRHAVISFLKRLEQKGAVHIDAARRPSRYMARLSQQDAQRSETAAVLRRVFGGNLMLMVTNAVDSGELSDQETQALIDLLKKGG